MKTLPENPISIQLPGQLADLAGVKCVNVSAQNVEKAILLLNEVYPGLANKVLTDCGKIRPHILIFVDETEVRNLNGLATPLSGGETILIVPAFSGG